MTATSTAGLDAYLAEASKPVERTKQEVPAWLPICLCGHVLGAHPTEHGGTLRPPSGTVLEGCIGAGRGRRPFARMLDTDPPTLVRTATCPCTQWTPVIEFDRPRRVIFNAAMGNQHPVAVALKAFRTQVARKTGLEGEELVSAVDERFRWIEGTRRCAAKGCRSVDDVWPRYSNEDRETELLCEEHAR